MTKRLALRIPPSRSIQATAARIMMPSCRLHGEKATLRSIIAKFFRSNLQAITESMHRDNSL